MDVNGAVPLIIGNRHGIQLATWFLLQRVRVEQVAVSTDRAESVHATRTLRGFNASTIMLCTVHCNSSLTVYSLQLTTKKEKKEERTKESVDENIQMVISTYWSM